MPSSPDTEHDDKLARLESCIALRIRDGHIGIGDLVDWWTRILGKDLAEVGMKVRE